MKTLVNDPFHDDAAEMLAWLYGEGARMTFEKHYNGGVQRVGQAFMNALYEYDQESYDLLAASIIDPFYRDSRIPEALDRMTRK